MCARRSTFLRKRKDVDPKRIVLFGHSEGGLVALVAASKDEDTVAAVVLAGCASGTGGATGARAAAAPGREHEPQPDAERQARIDLQKRIQAAVVGETQWDGVPEPLRRQADTPWFRSFLGFSPATVIAKVKQPLLILQGDIDQEVPAHHADEARRDGEGTQESAARERARGHARRRQSPAGASKTGELDGVPVAGEQGRGSAGREDDGRLVGGGVGEGRSSEICARSAADRTVRSALQRPAVHCRLGVQPELGGHRSSVLDCGTAALWLHSYRSASIGSSRDARIAGSRPAMRPTAIRMPAQIASSSNDSRGECRARAWCRRAAPTGTAAG